MISAMTLVALTGCQTHLETRHDGDGRYISRSAGETEIRLGVDYALPMLQYQIKATRTLAACADQNGQPKPKFVFKVSAEPQYVAGERFVIDYEQLSGWSKISKIDLQTYDNGTIKSLNASAEDQSTTIIGNAVKSAVRVVSLVQGVPLATTKDALPDDKQPVLYACSGATLKLLEGLAVASADLKKATRALVEANDEIAMLERLAGMGGLDSSGKAKLVKSQTDLKAKVVKVSTADEEVASLLERLSVEETIAWPLDPKDHELNLAPTVRNQEKLTALFSVNDKSKGNTLAQLQAAMNLRGTLMAVNAPTAVTCASTDTTCGKALETESKKAAGLMYRNPVQGRLVICDASVDSKCSSRVASGVVMTAIAMVPQLGQMRMLPYRNGAFQNNELKVTFRDSGGVATFNYDDKAARGVELSGAILSGLDDVTAYRDARNAFKEKKQATESAEADAKKKAQLDALDDEIARLEKLKKISELTAESVQGASVADLESEIARIDAQVALRQAKKRLIDAEAALQPTN
mgnify:CR=1 FL=1